MPQEGQTESEVLCSGIDCAVRVIADAYAKQLLERGVAGKPLRWRKMVKFYQCGLITSGGVYTYDKKDRRNEPGPDVELWYPDELPQEIWRQAVDGFTPHSLEDNLFRHLMPLLGDVTKLLPYAQLLDLVEEMFVSEGVLEATVRRRGEERYFFDEQRIYRMDTPPIEPKDVKQRRLSLWGSNKVNRTIWLKAVPNFQIGSTLRACIEIFLQTSLISTPLSYSYLERLVTRIEPPSYERETGNEKGKTFDRVRVSVNLSYTLHVDHAELVQAVKEHRKEIDELVIDQIAGDRRFRRFGVPVNVLKLTSLTLHRNNLEYIFELKDQP